MISVGNGKKRNIKRVATAYVVRVAFMAAMLTAFKFAISFIPNVEPVTLMIIVYGSAMGIAYALPSTLIFCAVEIAIYGVGSWVLLYFVHWPLLAIAASLLLRGRRLWLAVIIGGVGSVLFGVLSACFDTLICMPSLSPAHIGDYFVAYYLRGLYFDIVHVISSVIAVLVLYIPLVAVTGRFAPVAYTVSACGMRRYRYDEYKRVPSDLSPSDEIL